MELYLVAMRGDNLLNDQVVGGLIVHCQDKRGSVRLHVGGLAVCQTATILHAAGCAYARRRSKSQRQSRAPAGNSLCWVHSQTSPLLIHKDSKQGCKGLFRSCSTSSYQTECGARIGGCQRRNIRWTELNNPVSFLHAGYVSLRVGAHRQLWPVVHATWA